jgi:hypothetical protein
MPITLFLDWMNVGTGYQAQHIANYTLIQSAINALQSQVAGLNPLNNVIQAITPADAVTIDWSKGRTAWLLLNRATTAITMTSGGDGEGLILILQQDTVGGRLATFGAEAGGGSLLAMPPILSSGIGLSDYLGFIFRSSLNKYHFVSWAPGYSN